ncbi:MAG: glycosyltransferase, partial [Candidatus Omnitrophica bacterium]|nr:glycosyltransferase [Candidatus Omnitrophota bacterium]
MSEPATTQTLEPLVSLIIVTYNGLKYLGPCLESVFALDYPADRLEVLVVDNGSSDGSAERVREQFPQVRWLVNEVNNYCRANNVAFSHAKGTVIGFLNNDVRLDRRWLRELLPVLLMDERIGAVAGKVLLNDGRIDSAGHIELPHGVWADRGHGEPDVSQFDMGGRVDSLSGSAVLYRRSCLDDVGPFDEDFHMYYEDVDLTYRCRQRGWKLTYVPGAIAHHTLHGTASEDVIDQLTARNRLLFLAKHRPERLAPALSVNERSDPAAGHGALEVLGYVPAVTTKLIKHHGVDGLARWLPGIVEELGKLIQRERQLLSTRLAHEQQTVTRFIEERDRARQDSASSVEHRHRAQLEEARAMALAEERRVERERLQSETERLWAKVAESDERAWTRIREIEQQLLHEQHLLAEREGRLGRLEQELASKDVRLEESQQVIRARDRSLHQLAHTLHQNERVLTEAHATLATRDAALADAQARLTALDQALAAQAETLRMLDQTLTQRDQTLQQTHATLATRDAALADAQACLTALSDTLSQREQAMGCLGQERDHARQELEAVYRSTAFRYLVQPLWALLVVGRRPVPAVVHWPRRRILVVKPCHVSAADARQALTELHARWPHA